MINSMNGIRISRLQPMLPIRSSNAGVNAEPMATPSTPRIGMASGFGRSIGSAGDRGDQAERQRAEEPGQRQAEVDEAERARCADDQGKCVARNAWPVECTRCRRCRVRAREAHRGRGCSTNRCWPRPRLPNLASFALAPRHPGSRPQLNPMSTCRRRPPDSNVAISPTSMALGASSTISARRSGTIARVRRS